MESLAQKDFQEAVALLNFESNQLQKLTEQKTAAHERAAHLVVQGGAQGPALMQIHEFLKGQVVYIHNQQKKISELEKLVEAKREILRQAAQEYKIIEKVREKKREEFLHEQGIRDQQEMDEQSILRFKPVKDKDR